MNSSMEKPYVVGIDIGGTNTVFGIVDARGTIIASGAVKTQVYPTVEEYADEVCKNLLPLIIANGGVDKIRVSALALLMGTIIPEPLNLLLTCLGKVYCRWLLCSKNAWVYRLP